MNYLDVVGLDVGVEEGVVEGVVKGVVNDDNNEEPTLTFEPVISKLFNELDNKFKLAFVLDIFVLLLNNTSVFGAVKLSILTLLP